MDSLTITQDQCIICTQPIFRCDNENFLQNSKIIDEAKNNNTPTPEDVLLILFQPLPSLSAETTGKNPFSQTFCSSCYRRNEEILDVIQQLKILNARLESFQASIETDFRRSLGLINEEPLPVTSQSLLELDWKNSIRAGICKKLNLIQIRDSQETEETLMELHSEPEGDGVEEDPLEPTNNNNCDQALSSRIIPEVIVLVEKLPKSLLGNLPINIHSLAEKGIEIPPTTKRKKKRASLLVCKVPKCTRKLCFRTKEQFDMHMLIHRGITHPYPCSHCDMRFKKNHLRAVHVRNVHEGRKTYFCEQCGKGCISKTELTRHVTTHSTEANIPCPLCPLKFRTPYSLRSHKLWCHNPKRDHNCDRCGKCFVTSQKLRNHVKAIHEPEVKPHVCHLCGKGFPIQGYLYMHMRNNHKLNMEGQPYVPSSNTQRGNNKKRKSPVKLESGLKVENHEQETSQTSDNNKLVSEQSPSVIDSNDDFLAQFTIPPANEEFILGDQPEHDTIIVVSTSTSNV